MPETLHHIISKDGTKIGYRQTGNGPGLIICHGGGRISQNYLKLAQELSNYFTVYIPDRRGRGLSGSASNDYDMTQACEDLLSVIETTEAEFIFGHSAGGLIALETAIVAKVKRLAVYEPPVSIDKSLPADWLPDFEIALKKEQLKKAMAISLKGLKVHDGITKMPFWSLMLFINVLTFFEKKKAKGTRMLDLLPTLVPDMKMAVTLDSKYERYKKIDVPVFLMSGSKSPAYFHKGIKALEDTLPKSATKIFEGFDHYSPEEKTGEIALALKNFFMFDR